MARKFNMIINPRVKEVLSSINVSLHDGLGYLICVYYGIDPSYIPTELKRKVLATRIINKNYETGEVKWKMPLFEGQEIGFEWINDYMDLFKAVNPSRRGTKSIVLSRMKKFFIANPSIRKEDVMEATKLYIKNLSNPDYIKLSHKFISERDGSMLEDWVETYIKTKDTINTYKRKMM